MRVISDGFGRGKEQVAFVRGGAVGSGYVLVALPLVGEAQVASWLVVLPADGFLCHGPGTPGLESEVEMGCSGRKSCQQFC